MFHIKPYPAFKLSASTEESLNKFCALERACIVMGGTGAVGQHLVAELLALDAFKKVTVISRKNIKYEGPNAEKLHEVIADFEHPEKHFDQLSGHTHFFCCHGTTRAQAGSAEAFKKIDHDFVTGFAGVFQKANVSNADNLHFVLLTSTGSDPNSWLLYPQTKGRLERNIALLGFAHLSILRPGLLVARPPGRLLEKVLEKVAPAVEWVFKPISIKCEDAALAMISAALSTPSQTTKKIWDVDVIGKASIFSNDDMLNMVQQFRQLGAQ